MASTEPGFEFWTEAFGSYDDKTSKYANAYNSHPGDMWVGESLIKFVRLLRLHPETGELPDGLAA